MTKPEGPAQEPQTQTRIVAMAPTGRGSWLTVLDDVEIPTAVVERFDLRAGGNILVVPATPAPSQPAAREFRLRWSHKPTVIPPNATGLWYSEECTDELMVAYARQQTAAKEADEPTPQEIIAAYDRAIKDKEAAERERDSLREANARLAADLDAALKAGKDGQE